MSINIQHVAKSTRDDGGGRMVITGDSRDEKRQIIAHFKLGEASMPHSADGDPFVYEEEYNEVRPAFRVQVDVEKPFTEHYFHRLELMTGHNLTAEAPSDHLMAYYPWDGLCYTHYMQELHIKDQRLHCTMISHAQDWGNKTAAENARVYARDYARESVGRRPVLSEYIETGNAGLYKKNPDYPARQPVMPYFDNRNWLFQAMCELWTKDIATDGQRALVESDRKLMEGIRCAGGLHQADRGLRWTWEGDLVSWEEFKTL